MAKMVRVFLYKGKELLEIMGSPEANLKHYETIYPELVNASVEGPTIDEKKNIAKYEFKPKTATKG